MSKRPKCPRCGRLLAWVEGRLWECEQGCGELHVVWADEVGAQPPNDVVAGIWVYRQSDQELWSRLRLLPRRMIEAVVPRERSTGGLQWQETEEDGRPVARATYGPYRLEVMDGESAVSWWIYRGRKLEAAGGGTTSFDLALAEAEEALRCLVSEEREGDPT